MAASSELSSSMSSIVSIHARQIFDSRGNPTVEVDLTTNKGILLHCVSFDFYVLYLNSFWGIYLGFKGRCQQEY